MVTHRLGSPLRVITALTWTVTVHPVPERGCKGLQAQSPRAWGLRAGGYTAPALPLPSLHARADWCLSDSIVCLLHSDATLALAFVPTVWEKAVASMSVAAQLCLLGLLRYQLAAGDDLRTPRPSPALTGQLKRSRCPCCAACERQLGRAAPTRLGPEACGVCEMLLQ